MSLLQRARESGRCPPSFLKEENMSNEDGFESEMMAIIAAGSSGLTLSTEPSVAAAFPSILKKSSGIDAVPGTTDDRKKAILELRRVLILTLVGGTPKTNPSVDRVLETAYLSNVKVWLDEGLSGSTGVDFLLHLLKNIADLPVTTNMVKQSGLGKLVGSIEKHRICSGPNEGNIRERVDLVKSSWKASVKARKIAEGSSQPKVAAAPKREIPTSSEAASPSAKRAKVAESSPKSSLSSLLNRMSGGSTGNSPSPSAGKSPLKPAQSNGVKATNSVSSPAKKKKASARVKWADHFGGDLEDAKMIEGENFVEGQGSTESWSDRKKRDREKEKKLLLTMKKSKLLDDDDEVEPVVAGMKPTVAWKSPALLPENPDAPKPQLSSTEVATQNERMKTAVAAQYFSDQNVPPSPAPLSQIEQALDMTAQSSANVAKIPFFAAQQPDASVPDPANNINQVASAYTAPPVEAPKSFATPEFVQALGLPLYLVGQDTQALQTLASSPGLLSSLVDPSTGTYDQTRLLSLVQTLSGTSTAAVPPTAPPTPYIPQVPPPATYGSNDSGYSAYGASNSYGAPRTANIRGGDEGNLHVSGYGPMTTQADIIALFSPYVVIDEVVMKGSFCFVNTRDPVNAQRAREALHGTLLGGQPIRINQAQRKGRDSSISRASASSFSASTYGPPATSFGVPTPATPSHAPPPPPPPPTYPPHGSSVDHVRDSRGNAPTKNLFVAGYGPGTSEAQIRQIFSQHTNVVGVVLKGNFTFVNTSSREDAVKAREMLQGNMINGGPLRINFAKETGRLGTSFDLTYNQQSGPNARRTSQGQMPPVSYYGRN